MNCAARRGLAFGSTFLLSIAFANTAALAGGLPGVTNGGESHRYSLGAEWRHESAWRLVNANVGYRFSNGLSLSVTGFNLLDASDNDITYFYESQLPAEAAPLADRHFHPVEPRTFRLTLKTHW